MFMAPPKVTCHLPRVLEPSQFRAVKVVEVEAIAASSNTLVTSSFLFLVVRPGAPSGVLVPSSNALCS